MSKKLRRKPSLLVVSSKDQESWLCTISALDTASRMFSFERLVILKRDGAMGIAAYWAEGKGIPVVLREKESAIKGAVAALVFNSEKFKSFSKKILKAGIPARLDRTWGTSNGPHVAPRFVKQLERH